MAKKGLAVAEVRGGRRDKRGTRIYDVNGPDGKLLCRVGNYHSPVVNKPEGMPQFLDFLPVFRREVENGKWGGLVFDSVSLGSLAARKYHQYDLNPDTANPLQWYGGGSDIMEEVVMLQLPDMPCHIGVAFHVHTIKTDADEEEGRVRTARQPYVPGKRMVESKSVAACYPELWYLYSTRDKEGKKVRRIQTDGDREFIAGTCIGVPDDQRLYKDQRKTWKEILTSYQGGPLHIGVYGDPHKGKTTLLAGLALWLADTGQPPLYVALFDGVGKDTAYRLLGTVEE